MKILTILGFGFLFRKSPARFEKESKGVLDSFTKAISDYASLNKKMLIERAKLNKEADALLKKVNAKQNAASRLNEVVGHNEKMITKIETEKAMAKTKQKEVEGMTSLEKFRAALWALDCLDSAGFNETAAYDVLLEAADDSWQWLSSEEQALFQGVKNAKESSNSEE